MNCQIVHSAFDALPYLCLKILGFMKWAKIPPNAIFCCLYKNCYKRRRVRCLRLRIQLKFHKASSISLPFAIGCSLLCSAQAAKYNNVLIAARQASRTNFTRLDGSSLSQQFALSIKTPTSLATLDSPVMQSDNKRISFTAISPRVSVCWNVEDETCEI